MRFYPGSVVAIGSFDGVHLGHRLLIETARSLARTRKKKFGLISFDPIPIRFFNPDFPVLITTKKEKERVLKEIGIGFIHYFNFDHNFARLDAEEFLMLIRDRIKPNMVVVGANHRFGKDRRGDVRLIRRCFNEVIVVDPLAIEGSVVSSTAVRENLVMGRINRARMLLGRPYQISGRIEPGEQKGRGIGFPTINLGGINPDKVLPMEGVYLVRVKLKEKTYFGAMCLGEVRSIKHEHSIEIHLINYGGDAYGKAVVVDFLIRLRGLRHFRNRRSLRARIRKDIELCKLLIDRI
ncbi:MAG TPA: riboflavin biosynthesis protein RibF [bacterium (Candidatus Stahlbacteria)]|nr:riboflavin biosynthesis protein RibF [Candidatus Stahlbacteria bacterium]